MLQKRVVEAARWRESGVREGKQREDEWGSFEMEIHGFCASTFHIKYHRNNT